MAPNIKAQTESVVFYLLADEDECNRSYGQVEPDSKQATGNFDPVIIADRLRTIGDALNKDQSFIKTVKDLTEAVTEEAVATVFEQSVDILCESYVSREASIAPELQLIHASVALGLYLKKNSPALKGKVMNAMSSFLNRRVSRWVDKQGGWDKVPVPM
ncbi:uncharacterized protein LOC103144350 isoform X2 [Poecilia formosa]|uniref:uncharacterized protein LOC103144350 isoform X2 n=1 Tax=Poecilia formosa TaxID=48698 RepID=UPI0007B9F43D|nr:PREDICTED: uncharacterized protein LOC103144350 isoform X2 [Poecilia formosa]